MFENIIIYRDAIVHIFTKPIAKMFYSIKVRDGRKVLQWIHGGSCETEVSFD